VPGFDGSGALSLAGYDERDRLGRLISTALIGRGVDPVGTLVEQLADDCGIARDGDCE
jgi:hypothetical protein